MTGPILAPKRSLRICPNCDGFASAAVSAGSRDTRGYLPTITIDCPVCDGHGTVFVRTAQLVGGRA